MAVFYLVRERVVERYLRSQVIARGGRCYKTKSDTAGFPDRVILFKGNTLLVETKRPTGKLSAVQEALHRQIARCQVTVHTLYSKDDVDYFMAVIL